MCLYSAAEVLASSRAWPCFGWTFLFVWFCFGGHLIFIPISRFFRNFSYQIYLDYHRWLQLLLYFLLFLHYFILVWYRHFLLDGDILLPNYLEAQIALFHSADAFNEIALFYICQSQCFLSVITPLLSLVNLSLSMRMIMNFKLFIY